jgi:hypothetical protein
MGARKKNAGDGGRSVLADYSARTELGKRLWEIRKQAAASGQPLVGWDEIEKEIEGRRGGAE